LSSRVSGRAIYCDSRNSAIVLSLSLSLPSSSSSPPAPPVPFLPLVRILFPSLRKQFIRLFVFRLAVSRGLYRLLPHPLVSHQPPFSPSRWSAVTVTFSSNLRTRLNCFSIRQTATQRIRLLPSAPSTSIIFVASQSSIFEPVAPLQLIARCSLASTCVMYVFMYVCIMYSRFCEEVSAEKKNQSQIPRNIRGRNVDANMLNTSRDKKRVSRERKAGKFADKNLLPSDSGTRGLKFPGFANARSKIFSRFSRPFRSSYSDAAYLKNGPSASVYALRENNVLDHVERSIRTRQDRSIDRGRGSIRSEGDSVSLAHRCGILRDGTKYDARSIFCTTHSLPLSLSLSQLGDSRKRLTRYLPAYRRRRGGNTLHPFHQSDSSQENELALKAHESRQERERERERERDGERNGSRKHNEIGAIK